MPHCMTICITFWSFWVSWPIIHSALCVCDVFVLFMLERQQQHQKNQIFETVGLMLLVLENNKQTLR